MAALRKMYPKAPNPTSYQRTNWSKDPYAYGSYSFVKLGAEAPDDCDSIAEGNSTNYKLYFAGEATNCEMIATVHGAYISGLKTVKSIIKQISSNGNIISIAI